MDGVERVAETPTSSSMRLQLVRTSRWTRPEIVQRAAAAFKRDLDDARTRDEHEHIATVLLGAAKVIDEYGLADFEATGLGQSRPWPSDVFGEFSMIAEDLPDVIDAVLAGHDTELGFHEQGCARSVRLQSADGVVLVSGGEVGPTTAPWEHHEPCPTGIHELTRMLQDLVTVFAEMVTDLHPDVAQVADFQNWRTPRIAPGR